MGELSGDPSYDGLEARIQARADAWRKPPPIPKSLFHYTSSAAFLSIVQEDKLWFSDFRYMNDLSELRYGVDLFASELQRREQATQDPDIKKFVSYGVDHFARALIYTDVFVFCMCEENNLLNQWRVYGRDTVPLCMEFPVTTFMGYAWKPYSFDVVPMEYDRATQERIVRDSTDVAIEYALEHRAHIFGDEGVTETYVQMWVAHSVDACTSLKHPQFSVEREWRLSTRWGLEHRVTTGRSFRTSPAGIVPYLIMEPEQGEIELSSVTIGPCSQPEIQRRTVVEYLQQKSKFADVHLSNLPVRV